MNTPIQRNAAASGSPEMNPGDAAPAGTPGTGEDICPKCKGTGKIDGTDCQNCGGTGRIVEGIGGG
ncbi:hypothetical protein [Noviherbaspirillum sedimenti]|uniref:Molecular chaperone DnaJ n=1 Tax=Noviherbaspirillum sedimenti TaxID=2320865 RepID=A0A3A3GA31_9BURK|nr:hypothetical protein [Noviherbaspirillum sedimenti]RJG03452.1 hypothetical protein D3878_19165 [Noviherbaspirillum sedimenti]